MHSLQPTQLEVQRNFCLAKERVSSVCQRVGRDPNDVRIVGVTKYVDAATASFLVDAGCLDLGESRPQSLWEKAQTLAEKKIRWHFIGHLQRNKAKRTIELVSMIHSLDSERLLDQLADDSESHASPIACLLEINVSGDDGKTGMSADDARRLLESWSASELRRRHVSIVGLMGMSSLEGGATRAHRDFESLRSLRDRFERETAIPLPELSMGMSDDFEIGIEHGATMIRLGSCLFATETADPR